MFIIVVFNLNDFLDIILYEKKCRKNIFFIIKIELELIYFYFRDVDIFLDFVFVVVIIRYVKMDMICFVLIIDYFISIISDIENNVGVFRFIEFKCYCILWVVYEKIF